LDYLQSNDISEIGLPKLDAETTRNIAIIAEASALNVESVELTVGF